MKINITVLLFFFIFIESFSQNSPRVPERIRIDNMVLNISDDVIPIIQNEVDALHINDKYFQIFVDRINIYFPVIERILKEEEMPDDLKYLALQESALIPDAVSSSNAVGFWQFKKETAEDYGLTVDDKVDERKNIISSTRAASKYIKNSNYLFENCVFFLAFLCPGFFLSTILGSRVIKPSFLKSVLFSAFKRTNARAIPKRIASA